ncbi:MAG: Gfo/Idh/MocA family oxidoreductase [Acidobacteriaceae bacterium]|nr:Gfo/Idh/MocA family oxidoreductase [Acidobacteriaceae bacterium]
MNSVSRRSFLKTSQAASAAATAFTIIKPELVRGAGKELLKAGLVGCGGRGTQAVIDLMRGTENVDIIAMGDIFEDKLEGSLRHIKEQPDFANYESRVKVDAEHRFVGFEAYKKVLASDIDFVMLATPPGYRPLHFEAAVEARKHVFCEKPFGTDPVNVRRFMAAAKKSEELKLTVMSGAQRRNDSNYVTTVQKIQDGAIGDLAALYAYWVGSPVIQQPNGRNPKWGDMTWEHRNWYSFVWICGDQIVEQHLHNIDVCNWIVGTHPVEVTATGGAAWRSPNSEIYGNIYDHVSSDFVYPNGVHMSSYCRQFPKGSAQNVSESVIGTKGRSNAHDLGSGEKTTPYVAEHTALAASIRGDGPYVNHGMAVAESTMTCIMGRESAYSGLKITWDQIMNSQLDLFPKAFDYDLKLEPTAFPVPGVYRFV